MIRIDLKDCQQAIANLPGHGKQRWVTLEEIIEFLSAVERKGLDSVLAQGLLQYNLKYTTLRPLLILFDGFDEINKKTSRKNHSITAIPERGNICKRVGYYKVLQNGRFGKSLIGIC